MKSRLSLRNLARAGLSLLILIIIALGCAPPTKTTYRKEELAGVIQDILKKEYKIEVTSKLAGSTLWVYVPLTDLVTKADKPDKFVERFTIEKNEAELKNNLLGLEYSIKAIPEKERLQEIKYDKDAMEKINSVWRTLRRVIFSMERKTKNGPEFFCLVTADIKNGFETRELFYYLDLIKVSYEFISWGEYQHRSIDESFMSPEIIGDKEGAHLNYKSFTMEEFICMQIQHRVKMKFQKPEVEKSADIDKEILKIVTNTVAIYKFRDFSTVELKNLVSESRTILNRAAVLAGPG